MVYYKLSLVVEQCIEATVPRPSARSVLCFKTPLFLPMFALKPYSAGIKPSDRSVITAV